MTRIPDEERGRLAELAVHLAGGRAPGAFAKSQAPTTAPEADEPWHSPRHQAAYSGPMLSMPGGRQVHPMSEEGRAHIESTVVAPAEDHGRTIRAHLGRVMHGLDVDIKTRTKTTQSIIGKMAKKGRQPHEFGDLLGARVTVRNPAHFAEAQRRLQAHMAGTHPLSGRGVDIHHEDDKIKSPMESGYRSVHYDAAVHGTNTEVQLRQPHHTVWADHCHDNFYKDHALRARLDANGAPGDFHEVQKQGGAYMKAVSDHLHAHDGREGPGRPEAPDIVKKHGLEFPWHKLKGTRAPEGASEPGKLKVRREQ